jgi:hypothetical protein
MAHFFKWVYCFADRFKLEMMLHQPKTAYMGTAANKVNK